MSPEVFDPRQFPQQKPVRLPGQDGSKKKPSVASRQTIGSHAALAQLAGLGGGPPAARGPLRPGGPAGQGAPAPAAPAKGRGLKVLLVVVIVILVLAGGFAVVRAFAPGLLGRSGQHEPAGGAPPAADRTP